MMKSAFGKQSKTYMEMFVQAEEEALASSVEVVV
jgi:hypothetical protein